MKSMAKDQIDRVEKENSKNDDDLVWEKVGTWHILAHLRNPMTNGKASHACTDRNMNAQQTWLQ